MHANKQLVNSENWP